MNPNEVFIYVLGTAQDGGYPHVGCTDVCCEFAWKNLDVKRLPSCVALIDKSQKKYWLFDVTPEVKEQIYMLNEFNCSLAGVFITHAHTGHYMGLISFGLEMMNLKALPIYVMPRMKNYIENNSLFNQLIENENIQLYPIRNDLEIETSNNIFITPFEVPHRNELSETVGFKIKGSRTSVVYLPDIDSWDGFENQLRIMIKDNDLLFIDGTFFTKDEIKSRDISKIPHPEIIDTMDRLSDLPKDDKSKIHFIHFNHTNEVLKQDREVYNKVLDLGFSISKEKQLLNIN